MEVYEEVLKEILVEVQKSFESIFNHQSKDLSKLNEPLITEKVETVLLILKDKKIMEKLITKEQLE